MAPVSDPERRLLVRMPNWIGDGVMATPALLALSRVLPRWTISVQAVPRTWGLWRGLDHPCELLPPLPERPGRGREAFSVARALRGQRFEAALVFPPSFSSALLPALARIPVRIGWPSEGRGSLLNARVGGRTRRRHLREQYEDLVRATSRRLGGETEIAVSGARVPLPAEELVAADLWWASSGLDPARTLALAPGATYGETKRWPVQHYSELAGRLLERGWTLLWIGGPDERELTESLAAQADSRHQSVSVAGRWSLVETMSRLRRLRGVVSNDSGALHLAQAAGAPVVAIFGSTSPAWTGPVGEAQHVVYDGVSCSPCFSRDCPTAIECLTGIGVERVWEALASLVGPLESEPPPGRPAMFLDRDGTLLEPVPYLRDPEQVRLLPGVPDALRAFRDAGFALVVVTNQSAVARGILDRPRLQAIHHRMEALLAVEGVTLDGIEICPHHPDFTGACACRKPEPGLLLRAAHRLELDLRRSYLAGDAASDLEAARNAGVRPILVRTGYGRETEASSSGVSAFETLLEAARSVLPAQR